MARRSDEVLARAVSRSNAAAAGDWSRAALRRDPSDVAAWRNLGLSMIALGQPLSGYRLLHFAQHLSRRDTGVQLALLEASVQRGDIAGALKHYDVIFRVSPTRDTLLMPILVAASSDPQVRPQIVALVRRSPSWRRRFYSALLAAPPSADVTATLVEQLAAAGALSEKDIFAALIFNLAMTGQEAAAWRVYAAVKPAPPALIRNGGFEDPAPIAPFDWLLETGDAVSAAIIRRSGGQQLELTASRGDAGPGARQLLALQPGTYRLGFDAGRLDGMATPVLYWQVRCGRDGAMLSSGAGVPAPRAAMFDVSSTGCADQWLEFGFQAAGSDEASGSWLDRVTLARIH